MTASNATASTAGVTSSTTSGPDPSDSDPTTGNAEDSSGSSTSGSTGGSSSSSGGLPACEGMSFFATSEGSGKLGGNLGGLEGADAFCQGLAEAAGQGDCTWHAYLSTSKVDARDRIGSGPWLNFDGETIAEDVDALHDDGLSNDDPQHVLDETGAVVPGAQHDILTGSNPDGTAHPSTCNDWTSAETTDTGMVGHSDVPSNPAFSPSWNSAHESIGCAAGNLVSTSGEGRLYCFAL